MTTVDELKARIAELETANARAETVTEVGTKMSAATSEQEILGVLAGLTEQHGVMLSSLSYLHVDEDNTPYAIEIMALQSGDGQPQPLSILPRSDFPVDEFPTLDLVFASPNAPTFIEDTLNDPRTEGGIVRAYLREVNQLAMILMPLKSSERWQGVFIFAWSEPTQFDDELRALLTDLTPKAADVVAGRRAYLEAEAARRHNEMLLQIGHKLNTARSEDDLLQAMIPLAEETGMKGAGLFYTDKSDTGAPEWSEMVAAWNRDGKSPIPVGARFHLPDLPSTQVWLHKPEEIYLSPDITQDERIDADSRELLLKSGNRATVVIPLTEKGHWLGYLNLFWGERYDFSRRELALYQALPNIAAQAVANRRLQNDLEQQIQEQTAALRASERQHRVTIDAMDNIIHVIDADLNFVLYNSTFKQWCESLGIEKDLTDQNLFEVFPFLPQENRAEYEQVRSTGETVVTEDETEIAGRKVITQTHKIPITEKGEVVQFLTVIRDITEQKQAEEERARLQQEIIQAQQNALHELSTPIIPIMEGILVMPLIGSIDTGRAREVTRALLAGITQHRAKIVILDITGVSVIDSGVADHLNKTIQAARLKGTHAIITGISDAVAETVVDLGIDWSGIQTLRDLQTGLVAAMHRLNIDIKA